MGKGSKRKRAKEEKKSKGSKRGREDGSRSSSPSSRPSASPSPAAPDPESMHLRLVRYVVGNRARKLRKALRRLQGGAAVGNNAASSSSSSFSSWVQRVDSHGQTLLHQACVCGHVEVAKELLSFGADPAAWDRHGNTPGHVAGLKGHLVLLSVLLQAPGGPDIDTCVNERGLSLRAVAQAAMRGTGGAQPAADPSGAGGLGFRGDGEEEEQEEEEDGSEEWRQRLREEGSDGEHGWGGADDSHVHGQATGAAAGVETDDEWAARLWREMQERRRKAAQASASAFFGSGRSAEAEAAAAAAAAARKEESDRVLREERLKDAEWRRRAAGGLGAGPQPRIGPELPREGLPVVGQPAWDFAELRETYESAWSGMERRVAAVGGDAPGPSVGPGVQGLLVGLEDVPWPLPGWCAQEQQGRQGQQRQQDLSEVLLWGASGPAEVKRRLRAEILRWHPDKFTARFGALLLPADRPAILQGVQRVSQQLTQLLSGGGRS